MPDLLQDLFVWLPGLEQRPLLFILAVCGICLSLVIPSSSLGLAAGYFYGFGLGLLYVFAGLLLGASGCFMLARWLLRGLVRRYLARFPRLAGIVSQITENGWRLCLLVRLLPVSPFAVTSYALGVSEIRWSAFLLGTIGILPNLVLLVYTGSLVRGALDAWQQASSPQLLWAHIALGCVSVAALALLIRITLKAIESSQKSRPQ